MHQEALVPYLYDQNNATSTRKLSERLSDALKKYQLDSKLNDLSEAYSNSLKHEDELKKVRLTSLSIIEAFSTLNIAPSNSYDRYMAILNNKSDLEAISSDWEMVGEDLSSAWVRYILESKEDHG